MAWLRVKLNHLSWSSYVLPLRQTLPHGLSDWAVKDNTHKKYQIEKVWNQFTKKLNQVIIQCFLLSFIWFCHLLWFFCLPLFCICTDDTKYCKHGIDLLILCDIGPLQLIIFQVDELHEVRICSLQVVSGCFLLTVGCFMLFLSHSRLFQVASCSL